MYQRYFKRIFDIVCALLALVVFCWLYALLAILIRIKLGSPVIFKQPRPGMKDKDGKEKIFCLYKFRTMTDERDENGLLLPDEARMTRFGQKLRDWSLDELPEVINILRGEMSVVGPRPLLVRDMVFMTPEQRKRHDVKPGLSGWAQVNGRNAISWEDKLKLDLEYIQRASFLFDLRIVSITVKKVIKTESITFESMATAEDFGDNLLREGKVDADIYADKQLESIGIMERYMEACK